MQYTDCRACKEWAEKIQRGCAQATKRDDGCLPGAAMKVLQRGSAGTVGRVVTGERIRASRRFFLYGEEGGKMGVEA